MASDTEVSLIERERIIGDPATLSLQDAVLALKSATESGDEDAARKAGARIKASAGTVRDALVLADKLSATGKYLKDMVTYAALNPYTLEDEDLLVSGIDGIRCQRGATRYVKTDGTKWSDMLKDIEHDLGIPVENVVDNCAAFSLKTLAEFCGLTQKEFLQRFGTFDTVRNAPTVKRTW